jgi:hypothetical protein
MKVHNIVKNNKTRNIDKDLMYSKVNNNNYQTIKIQQLFEMGLILIYYKRKKTKKYYLYNLKIKQNKKLGLKN